MHSGKCRGCATNEVGSGQTYATIQACLNVVTAGDTCSVHTGTYTEQLSLPVSGTSANRTMVKNNGYDMVTVQSTSSPVLSINAKSYWTTSGINFTYNGSGSNPRVINNTYGDNVDGITIQNGTIRDEEYMRLKILTASCLGNEQN